MRDHGRTPEAQLQAGFRCIMMHDLPPKKLAVLTRLYRTTEAYYRQKPNEAESLLDRLGIDCATLTPQQAALTVAANTMLNLDEVITKE